jgi:hypothetical protein
MTNGELVWKFGGTGFVAGVVSLLLLAGIFAPRNLSDDQLRTVRAGAQTFAAASGMTLLSCFGSDWKSKGSDICTLRTFQGNEYYLKCTYNQEGCLPATYKE